MTTQKEIRESFWANNPEIRNEYKRTYRQNQYRCDIRVMFVEYVDSLSKNNQISERLARRVTL